MKFIYRTLLSSGAVVAVLIYFYCTLLDTPPETELLPYISDRFGEECVHEGVRYVEGEVFVLPCEECYCSFGRVECAVVHCKEIRNTLGMDLIARSVQVLIPTLVEDFAGTVAVMNSVLKHTKHKIKFTIVIYQDDDVDQVQVNHLKNWIEGSELRSADYVITPFNDRTGEGPDSYFLEDYQKKKQLYEENMKKEMRELEPNNRGPDQVVPSGGVKSKRRTAALLLNTLLPREHRVVLLSNHVIIKGDIAELFNVDMKGNSVAVINTCTGSYLSPSSRFKDFFKPPLLDHYEVPGDQCLFSPGVIVADLDRWFSGETESQLSVILWHVLRNAGDLVSSEEVSFAPLLLSFWNKSRDLGNVWNVCNLGNTECNHGLPAPAVVEGAKVIDWGFQRPWKCKNSFNLWKEYFLPDPTGMFRLSNPHGPRDDL